MNDNFTSLQIGSTGNLVKIVQQKLKILNLYNPSITGSFDVTTENAVKAFQQENNLEVTGVVDEEVFYLLLEQTESDIPQTFSLTPTLSLGSTGEDVRLLQSKLQTLLYYDGAVTGEYDDETSIAVQTFQLNNNITATGVVDNKTSSAIASLYSTLTDCNNIPSTPEVSYDSYVVKKGDTLYSIARSFNTSVENLININNLSSNTLTIGSVLKVPKVNTVGGTTYTVKKGDTLYSIARNFNIDVNSLKSANNLVGNTLTIGQFLNIPTTNSFIQYTVKKGDTLYSIARNYGVSVNEIMNLNNLSSSVLTVNQILSIPVEVKDNYTTYYVKSGDTLYSIARSYNTTVESIKQINNLTSNTLSIGQKLFIP